MRTLQLIYHSRLSEGLTSGEIRRFTDLASRNNAEVGITGMLLCSKTHFMQVLEGDRAQVSQLYNRIVADERHTDCVIIAAQPISCRDFADWGMEYCDILERDADLVLRHSGSARFEPDTMGRDSALGLLRDFRDRVLERAAS